MQASMVINKNGGTRQVEMSGDPEGIANQVSSLIGDTSEPKEATIHFTADTDNGDIDTLHEHLRCVRLHPANVVAKHPSGTGLQIAVLR